jgi:DNA-binding LytR/AlgR family response regulator
MIKAIAIDDEPIALRVIENFCKDVDFIHLEKTFEDPQAALRHLNKFPVDLLLLDIDMPGMTGLELYKKLKQNTMVIFITSRAEHAVEGFSLRAVDYLLKPFTFDRFQEAAKRAQEFINFNTKTESTENSKYLFIRADFSLVKIAIDEIKYIEALDDYMKIHIKDQKTLVARMTMKSILQKLPADRFIRIHRSFILPVERIKVLKTKSLLTDDMEMPVGNNYVKEVTEAFNKVR